MDELEEYILNLLRDNADIGHNGKPYGISFKKIEEIFKKQPLNIEQIQN